MLGDLDLPGHLDLSFNSTKFYNYYLEAIFHKNKLINKLYKIWLTQKD